MKRRIVALTISVVLLAPVAAPAQRGGHGGGGAPRAAPAPRAAAPARQAAPRQPGGFDLQRDISAPAIRSTRRPVGPGPVEAGPGGAPGRQVPIGAAPRRAIVSPHDRDGRPWQWNHGVRWEPAPHYWGGGFWGSFALGATAVAIGAAAFGVFMYDNQEYHSYEVAPDSPGAILLANYGLTQTPCGPPGLVVIFGPDDSAICADPNATVGPGEYTLDPTTLTIESD